MPPRDGKPKRPAFSDSEQAAIDAREEILDELVLKKKVDEVLSTRRKTIVDFVKGTANFIAAIGVIAVFGRSFIDWMWTWAKPLLKAMLGIP